MNIAVIFGGKSVEHEISILTAYQVIECLKTASYKVFPIYYTKENIPYLMLKEKVNDYKNLKEVIKKKKRVNFVQEGIKVYRKTKIDMAFISMHGTFGEDGHMSSLLEMFNIPYVGPNNISAGICQDKIFMKDVLISNGVPSLPYLKYHSNLDLDSLEYPVIIKPSKLGSSIGIEVAMDAQEMKTKINKALKYDKRLLIEKYMPDFREVNCAVRGGLTFEVSNLEEVSKSSFILSYEDKYESKKAKKKKPLINSVEAQKIKNLALDTFKAFSLSGVARIDFMIVKDTIYIEEVNTIPGSFAYYLFGDLLAHLEFMMKDALRLKKTNDELIFTYDKNILTLSAKK